MGNQLRFFIFLTLLGLVMATWKEFFEPALKWVVYIRDRVVAFLYGMQVVNSVNNVATTKEERSWLAWIRDIGYALIAVGGLGLILFPLI